MPTTDDPVLTEMVRQLVEVYRPECIWLFGSVARGEAGPDSDYDLMKAFLTWHDQPFKKTHDLAALGCQCQGIDDSLDLLIDRLDDLSLYAWAYRYPTSLA